jgi:hypothetical protein
MRAIAVAMLVDSNTTRIARSNSCPHRVTVLVFISTQLTRGSSFPIRQLAIARGAGPLWLL